jgi:dUTPase
MDNEIGKEMGQINPNTVVALNWVELAKESKIGPIGIDFTTAQDLTLIPVTKGGVAINFLFQETVRIPKEAYMHFFVRSSFTRKGIFYSGAIFEPYYGSSEEMLKTSNGKGATTGITLVNLGADTIEIKKGERVAQAVFYAADASKVYDGFYSKKFDQIKSQY